MSKHTFYFKQDEKNSTYNYGCHPLYDDNRGLGTTERDVEAEMERSFDQ